MYQVSAKSDARHGILHWHDDLSEPKALEKLSTINLQASSKATFDYPPLQAEAD